MEVHADNGLPGPQSVRRAPAVGAVPQNAGDVVSWLRAPGLPDAARAARARAAREAESARKGTDRGSVVKAIDALIGPAAEDTSAVVAHTPDDDSGSGEGDDSGAS